MRFLVSVFLFFLSVAAHAQHANLVGKTHAEHFYVLNRDWLEKIVAHKSDTSGLRTEINNLRLLAVKGNDKDLELYTYVLESYLYMLCDGYTNEEMLEHVNRILKITEEQNKDWAIAMMCRTRGIFYEKNIKNYELAFENYYRMYDLYKGLRAKDYPEKPENISNLALLHYHFRDYRKALDILIEAWKSADGIKRYDFLPMNLNSIGLCYQKLDQLDSSDYFFTLALEKAVERGFDYPAGVITGNLGYNHFLRGNYEQAIPLLEKDVAMAVEFKDWSLAVGSLVPLATIDIEKGDLVAAKVKLDTAAIYIARSGEYKRLEKLYPALSKFYLASGDNILTAAYLDSTVIIKDKLAIEFNQLLMARAQQKIEREEAQNKYTLLDSERKVKLAQRNMLFAGIIALMAIAIAVFVMLQKGYRQKKSELEVSENKLEIAEQQLREFTTYLTEKNRQIETLKVQAGENANTAIAELQHKTILTDKDWEQFKQLFEKVYPGFFHRLKTKFPGLSPGETRFIALSKLKLTGKEMAGILGVGQDAIRQYRTRIRKKLNLTISDDVDNVGESI